MAARAPGSTPSPGRPARPVRSAYQTLRDPPDTDPMRCCHADFALAEGIDRGFTVGMPTFTFGPGVLAEAGDHARDLGMKRVALFTDRRLVSGEYVARVHASLRAAGVGVTVYDAVRIEPDDGSFLDAARFAADGRFDGYVSVGGGSVMPFRTAFHWWRSVPDSCGSVGTDSTPVASLRSMLLPVSHFSIPISRLHLPDRSGCYWPGSLSKNRNSSGF